MSYWGSRSVSAVASNGVATQLFPTTIANSACTSTATYPPAAAGKIRRPTSGTLRSMEVTSDRTNAGVLELWDVAGQDRGASNNVNSGGDTMTDAYLSANGRLIAKINIDPAGGAGVPLSWNLGDLHFSKGLAARFVNGGPTGAVFLAPDVDGGFMVTEVPAG